MLRVLHGNCCLVALGTQNMLWSLGVPSLPPPPSARLLSPYPNTVANTLICARHNAVWGDNVQQLSTLVVVFFSKYVWDNKQHGSKSEVIGSLAPTRAYVGPFKHWHGLPSETRFSLGSSSKNIVIHMTLEEVLCGFRYSGHRIYQANNHCYKHFLSVVYHEY